MAAPDFLKFRCSNTDSAKCAACPRDFVVPVNALEGLFKDDYGKALILVKGIHYCPGPDCVNRLRFIETTANWADVIAALDGKVQDMGNINLTDQDNLPKG